MGKLWGFVHMPAVSVFRLMGRNDSVSLFVCHLCLRVGTMATLYMYHLYACRFVGKYNYTTVYMCHFYVRGFTVRKMM